MILFKFIRSQGPQRINSSTKTRLEPLGHCQMKLLSQLLMSNYLASRLNVHRKTVAINEADVIPRVSSKVRRKEELCFGISCKLYYFD